MGGFSDTQLDENVFNITFRGNEYISMDRASDDYGDTAYATTKTTPGTTYTYNKPAVEMTIICFAETPQTDATVFNAKFLSRSVRQKYKMEEPQE